MIPELLITCPRCKQPNFTPRGLRAHRCPSIITGGKARPLPKDEVAYAVAAADAARKKAAAFPNEQSSQGSTESHPAELQNYMAILTVFAFKRGLNPLVKPHSIEEILEACKSPSVAGIIRLIEAPGLVEAEAIASRRVLAGNYEHTFGYPPKESASGEQKTDAPKDETKFELVKQADAETEAKLDAHFKLMDLAEKGFHFGTSLIRGYALIFGAHANAVMEIAPYGTGEKRLAARYPNMTKTKMFYWRKFAAKIQSAPGKSSTVELLKAPTLGKKTIPDKTLKALDATCKAVMGDVGIMEYLKERPDKQPFKYDPADLVTWLKEKDPKFLEQNPDATYETLPGAMKKEFARWLVANRTPPAPEIKPEKEAKETEQDLLRAINSPRTKAMSHEWLVKLDALAVMLHDKYKDLLKADAEKGETL